MPSSDEDHDQFDVTQLKEIHRISKLKRAEIAERFHVSGWDDDTGGIEVERDPHKNASTEILWAAENGELALIKKLVTLDKELLKTKDKDGYTPLHRACYNDHVQVVIFLLSVGADYNAITEDKWQPLHSACRWNNAESAAKLLEAGADINSVSAGGQTPLHLASSNGSAKETLQLLLMQKNIRTDLTNDSNETAYDIALRSGKYYKIFGMVQPCINYL